jgi:hypothetical protein
VVESELRRRWDVERRAAIPSDEIEPLQWVAGIAAAGLLLTLTLQGLLHSVIFCDAV